MGQGSGVLVGTAVSAVSAESCVAIGVGLGVDVTVAVCVGGWAVVVCV